MDTVFCVHIKYRTSLLLKSEVTRRMEGMPDHSTLQPTAAAHVCACVCASVCASVCARVRVGLYVPPGLLYSLIQPDSLLEGH